MKRLQDLRKDNWVLRYLYNSESINDKINRRSTYYLYKDGLALKDFNKATRKYLNKVISLDVKESEVMNTVLKLI
jgi:hypothetical protein